MKKKFLISTVFLIIACIGVWWFVSMEIPAQKVKQQALANIPGLPPDPGEAGKMTLVGIDSDNDGVRDDVQRWIAIEYPNSAKTKAALMQYSKAELIFLLQTNKVDARNATEASGHAQACVFYVLGVSQQSIEVMSKLTAQILNTQSRSRAYNKADSYLSGGVYATTPDDQKKARCNFNPDSLPN